MELIENWTTNWAKIRWKFFNLFLFAWFFVCGVFPPKTKFGLTVLHKYGIIFISKLLFVYIMHHINDTFKVFLKSVRGKYFVLPTQTFKINSKKFQHFSENFSLVDFYFYSKQNHILKYQSFYPAKIEILSVGFLKM